MNSYQRLKQENERLKKEIYTLVMNPDSEEAMYLRLGYSMTCSVQDVALGGFSAMCEPRGIIDLLQ